MEQVHNNYPKEKLFQRVYYAHGLTLADERVLREAYERQKASYETLTMANRAAVVGLGIFGAYKLSLHVKPLTLGLGGIFYWMAANRITSHYEKQMFQGQINAAAKPFAAKYGVKEA